MNADRILREVVKTRVPATYDRVARACLRSNTILRLVTIGYVAGLILMTEQPARAYVDPGSGLLLLQMLGASVAGAFFFLRQRLRKFFRGGSDRASDPPSPVPDLPDPSGHGVPLVRPNESDKL